MIAAVKVTVDLSFRDQSRKHFVVSLPTTNEHRRSRIACYKLAPTSPTISFASLPDPSLIVTGIGFADSMEAKSPISPRFSNGDEFEDRAFHPTGGYRFLFLFLAIHRKVFFGTCSLIIAVRRSRWHPSKTTFSPFFPSLFCSQSQITEYLLPQIRKAYVRSSCWIYFTLRFILQHRSRHEKIISLLYRISKR